jgi:hypothetical protein
MSDTPERVDRRSSRGLDEWLAGLPHPVRRELYMLRRRGHPDFG